jgi:hypothetical protein
MEWTSYADALVALAGLYMVGIVYLTIFQGSRR